MSKLVLAITSDYCAMINKSFNLHEYVKHEMRRLR